MTDLPKWLKNCRSTGSAHRAYLEGRWDTKSARTLDDAWLEWDRWLDQIEVAYQGGVHKSLEPMLLELAQMKGDEYFRTGHLLHRYLGVKARGHAAAVGGWVDELKKHSEWGARDSGGLFVVKPKTIYAQMDQKGIFIPSDPTALRRQRDRLWPK